MQKLLDLQEWGQVCREVPASKLPRLVLQMCQALYEAACPGLPPIPKKIAVFNHVAAGNYREAILVMLPEGFAYTLADAEDGRAQARIVHAARGIAVESCGANHDLALLGCLPDLAFALGEEDIELVLA